MIAPMAPTREQALELDARDALAGFRDEFYPLSSGAIYMDGNSLGLLSKRAERATLDLLASWKQWGIEGWEADVGDGLTWFTLAEQLGDRVAPLVGGVNDASSGLREVVVANSTSVNIHQLVATFYQPQGRRTKILADALAFPTDMYCLQSQLRLRGFDPAEHLVVVESRDGRTLDEDDIIACMTDKVALALLPVVLYRSGQLLDVRRLTAAAHERGVVIGFDASHSVGVLPHRFHDDGVDFALWCSYKYMNGGPGAAAGLFVHERHFGRYPGLAGWFGSDKTRQFEMAHQLSPAADAGAYQIGTPHVLSMAPLIGALDVIHEAGIERIRHKSLALTAYLMALIDSGLAEFGCAVGTPRPEKSRGGHVALAHAQAQGICLALKGREGRRVIPDFRVPDIVRLAPSPLYTSFEMVWDVVQIIKQVMRGREYEQYADGRGLVT